LLEKLQSLFINDALIIAQQKQVEQNFMSFVATEASRLLKILQLCRLKESIETWKIQNSPLSLRQNIFQLDSNLAQVFKHVWITKASPTTMKGICDLLK
jgi:hypothetical protein